MSKKKKVVKNESTKMSGILSCCSSNIFEKNKTWWLVGAFVVVILIIVAVAYLAKTGTTGIGKDNAKAVVMDLLTGTGQTIDANALTVEEVSDLYKISFTLNGQAQEVYITKDGKNLVIDLVEIQTLKDKLKNKGADKNTVGTYILPTTIIQAPTIGNVNSKIEVLEFSDYQCPFCGLAYGSPWAEEFKTSQYASMIGTVQKLKEEYAKTNKIAFRHFPVVINTANGTNTESTDASNAALCANDQNKYWEIHAALFNAQTKEEYNGKYAKPKLKEIGAKIDGLDLTKFNDCVDKDKYVETVKNMTEDVSKAAYANTGSFGTPTFYIVLDASLGVDKIESTAKTAGYKVAPTSDKTKYVIIASPEFAKLKLVLDAFVS